MQVQAAPLPQQQPQQGSGSRTLLLAVAAILVIGLVGAVVMLMLPRKGALVVTVHGPGGRPVDSVKVFVDSKQACETSPCRVKDLSSGTHMVKVSAAGYQQTAEQAVKVPKNDEAVLTVDLSPASMGTGVKVSAEGSGLKLFVDGKEVGPLPQELKDMTPGRAT